MLVILFILTRMNCTPQILNAKEGYVSSHFKGYNFCFQVFENCSAIIEKLCFQFGGFYNFVFRFHF